MKIAELRAGMRRVDLTGEVVSVEQSREVMTKFGPAQVANATLQDESGSVRITLWNENVGKVTVGATVAIENGYVDSFRGELQLSAGRYGRMTIIE